MASIYSTPMDSFEPMGRQLIDTHPQDDGTDDDNLASSIMSKPGHAPGLRSKFSSLSIKSSKIDELWTARQFKLGQEELYAKGKCVYWTKNTLIHKSFNFTEPVGKLFWSQFSGADHTCIALATTISIFNDLGQHAQIPLPFEYSNIHASSIGLIIERSCDPMDDNSLPVLFSITHPSKEIAPIIFKHNSSRPSQMNKNLSYAIPNDAELVACHPTSQLCLFYIPQDGTHSIWKIRPTQSEELEEFQRYNDETATTTTNFHHQSSCSFNMSSKQRSGLMLGSITPSGAINFSSPKMDLRSKHVTQGHLTSSRLGLGSTLQASNTEPNSITNRSLSLNFTSTPYRNRMINYLRDNIGEPILPELTCDQIWSDSTSGAKANKIFSTTDLFGDEHLVIVVSSSNLIKVIRFEMRSLSLGRSIQMAAIDAMPVHSACMMIVLETNRTLALYSGTNRISSMNVPSPAPTALRQETTSSPCPMTPIQMSSARKRTTTGERGSVGSDTSIQQMFQALSPVPHASQYDSNPSSLDIKQIELVVGDKIYLKNSKLQRFKISLNLISQTAYVRRLIDAIMKLSPRDLGLIVITKWYQCRRSAGRPILLHASHELLLFKNWFLGLIGLPNVFNEDGSLSSDWPTTKKSRRGRDQLISNLPTLFYAMHLVFEEMLLTKANYGSARELTQLLQVIACLLKLRSYQSYYWLKFPDLGPTFRSIRSQLESLLPKTEILEYPKFFRDYPPSVMDYIKRFVTCHELHEEVRLYPFPIIEGVTENSKTILSLFYEYFELDRHSGIEMVKDGLKASTDILTLKIPIVSRFSYERVVDLMASLGISRNFISRLPDGISLYLNESIVNCRQSPPPGWGISCFELIGRKDLVDLSRGRSRPSSKSGKDHQDDDVLKLIFSDDIRVSEAYRWLASDVIVEFKVIQRQGASEEEARDDVHRQLYLLNVRSMAMPVGRGAIGLRTYSPVIGETFEVPRLELSGRANTEDRTIEYSHDISVYPWPFFHNGVAAGLTICASTATNIIDSTWINYNRPRSNVGPDNRDLASTNQTNEHAGFLFALGLNGHLEKLSLMALHDYLCQNNDLTKLAILLGLSASKRGSRDTNIIKILSIHVDSLLPPNSTELDVSASVRSASILGVGLLYQGSADSHISKVLLNEIGRLPGPEANSHVDRESNSLSAGLAFGLVNLCKGGSSTILSSDQLRLYMLGGKRKSLTTSQRERYFKQDCHRGEEEYINTHITSPGGTLGLGLMYHRSGNQSVADWMQAPETQTLLEHVRPDFLLLRMLSYGLIMWDNIEPTEEWINKLIPDMIVQNAFQRNPPGSNLVSPGTTDSSIDYELVSQAYCNIVAGCCMAIALRYAGSASQKAYTTIYKHTKMMIGLSEKPALADQAGRPCIEACLNVLVTSLAVVMAGTGDLGVMRVSRYLRSRLLTSGVFYGSYMASHLALGILFLGACRYSLSTSPESIGALVCALYPLYPNHTSDNRCHLQALRHLYVLAAEPRLLVLREIKTNKPMQANVVVNCKKMKTKSETQSSSPQDDFQTCLKLKAPCLVPEIDSIESVSVLDDQFWSIRIVEKETLRRCLVDGLSIQLKSEEEPAKISDLDDDHPHRCLQLDQIKLARSLKPSQYTRSRISLKSVLPDYLRFINGETDWCNTDGSVPRLIATDDLPAHEVNSKTVDMLQSLTFLK